ncbi:hypothetical protein L3Y34_003705 [Caenorhabditis briggsae]|uniref:Chromo domain-containing protein n=2 Tax=Caenorhabditis briggsae TaxID=6238 RepID=A0AAE9A9R5_CAEBR|nr:hypothetical protein L3Y34_003705 [Caenorhabditis briggsae]
MSSDEEEEFEIGAILHRMEFDKLIDKALASEAKFSPDSVDQGKFKHSKYAYLVHWKGYTVQDRTWEPESNLKKTGPLAVYKAEHNMPEGHQKFEKTYGSAVWRNLGLAADKVKGYRYLLSPQEKREQRERRERLERMNKLRQKEERRRREAAREKMVTPDDPERLFKKKKKKKRESDGEGPSRSSEYRIPKRKRSVTPEPSPSICVQTTSTADSRSPPSRNHGASSSMSSSSNDSLKSGDKEKTRQARPGIQPLDLKSPRIKKKKQEAPVPRTPGYDDVSPQPVRNFELPKSEPPRRSISTDSCMKIKIKRNSDGGYEAIPPQPIPVPSAQSSQNSTISSCTTSEEEEEIEENSQEKLEKHIETAQKYMKKLKIEMKEEFPVQIEASRRSRSFSTALDQRKHRRCQSAECLNDFFNQRCDLELFGKNFEKCSLVKKGFPAAVIRKYPKEEKKMIVKNKIRTQSDFKKIAEENQEAINKIQHPFKKRLETLLPELVNAYSYDDNSRFKELFEANIPKKGVFDPHRYALIVFIISYCKHRQWNADPKGLALVEADESRTWGKVRKQTSLCCEDHRKCTWMKLFMELVPSRLRFIESSKRNYNGLDGDDGPFRDDVYFHCMKLGAECQKRIFFEGAKPIGLQEDAVDDYSLDGMHLLSVQYGNLQRIPSYMALGGADINAIATYMPTKQVFRLQDYLKEWIEKNVTDSAVRPEHKIYYENLIDMVRLTASSLEIFVKAKVNEMIATRLNMEFKIHMDLTYPHIIRCSPINNVDNGGDGSHQVISSLFSPFGIGLRAGLPQNEAEGGFNEREIKKLRVALGKFQTLVARDEGRLIIALYRLDVHFKANVQEKFAVPMFKHNPSDDGFVVEGVNLVRQGEDLHANEADIRLINHLPLTSPGALYYCIENRDIERTLIVPGNAHIEIIGTFDKPISFVAQVFLIKKNF